MPDVRLIDANALPNFKCKVTATIGDQKGPAEMRFVFWQDIEKAPTIDAVPVVHGKWEICVEDWRHQLDGNKCSVCGFEYYGNLFKYCPNCGAKMDGGVE